MCRDPWAQKTRNDFRLPNDCTGFGRDGIPCLCCMLDCTIATTQHISLLRTPGARRLWACRLSCRSSPHPSHFFVPSGTYGISFFPSLGGCVHCSVWYSRKGKTIEAPGHRSFAERCYPAPVSPSQTNPLCFAQQQSLHASAMDPSTEPPHSTNRSSRDPGPKPRQPHEHRPAPDSIDAPRPSHPVVLPSVLCSGRFPPQGE